MSVSQIANVTAYTVITSILNSVYSILKTNMNINISFRDFSKICRCCLTYGELKPILDLKDIDIFATITNIKVKDEDKMPENMCLKCVQQLEDLMTFINMCKNNQKALKLVVLKELEQSNDDLDICDNDDVKSEDSIDGEFFLKNVKQEIVELEPEVVLQLNKEGPITCENCSETFTTLTDLSEHYKDFPNCRPKDVSSKKDICNIVDYLKKPKGRKKKEVKEESDGEPEYIKGRKLKGKRRFLCNYCGKNYTRKNGLDRHMLSHTGIKPFECRECGKCYITKDTLKTHMLTHTGIKAHKCTVCQKSFTQSSHLSYHMRRHAGEKPHTCSFCGKGFLSSYHLDRHKLMHTGVKPYECQQCGKQFVRSTTLRDHMLIHTGEKPFQCQHCGKQFNRKQSLTNHVLVHTGEKYKSSNNNSNTSVNMVSTDSNLRLFPEYPVNHLLAGDIPPYIEIKHDHTGCDVAPFLDNSVEVKASNSSTCDQSSS